MPLCATQNDRCLTGMNNAAMFLATVIAASDKCPICEQPAGPQAPAPVRVSTEVCPRCGREPRRFYDRAYRRRAREFMAGPRPPARPGLDLHARRIWSGRGASYQWIYKERVNEGRNAHPLYSIWYGMIARCYNPRASRYKSYGGRGITVCKRWRSSFEAFVSDMGPRPPGMSIDRKNNNGNYTPQNCRWATAEQQRANMQHNTQRKKENTK